MLLIICILYMLLIIYIYMCVCLCVHVCMRDAAGCVWMGRAGPYIYYVRSVDRLLACSLDVWVRKTLGGCMCLPYIMCTRLTPPRSQKNTQPPHTNPHYSYAWLSLSHHHKNHPNTPQTPPASAPATTASAPSRARYVYAQILFWYIYIYVCVCINETKNAAAPSISRKPQSQSTTLGHCITHPATKPLTTPNQLTPTLLPHHTKPYP